MISTNLKPIHRAKYKELRANALPAVQTKIFNQVLKELKSLVKLGKLKGYLGIYWPLPGEVDLLSLKKSLKTPIALPASDGMGRLSYRFWGSGPLKKDIHGIPAPLNQPELCPEDIALLIVPALAIDHHGQRLGYGGGYFDRLRAQKTWRAIPSLVVLPKACMAIEPLPCDPWDIPFDGWINEDGAFQACLKQLIDI